MGGSHRVEVALQYQGFDYQLRLAWVYSIKGLLVVGIIIIPEFSVNEIPDPDAQEREESQSSTNVVVYQCLVYAGTCRTCRRVGVGVRRVECLLIQSTDDAATAVQLRQIHEDSDYPLKSVKSENIKLRMNRI